MRSETHNLLVLLSDHLRLPEFGGLMGIGCTVAQVLNNFGISLQVAWMVSLFSLLCWTHFFGFCKRRKKRGR